MTLIIFLQFLVVLAGTTRIGKYVLNLRSWSPGSWRLASRWPTGLALARVVF